MVATLMEPPAGDTLDRLAEVADVLEVRADAAGDLDPAALRERFPGKLLYTLRSRAEGGRSDSAPSVRHPRIRAAAGAGWDLVDLEATRDLESEILGDVAPARRLISWHGRADRLERLRERADELLEVEARLYKLVVRPRAHGQELLPLSLLGSLRRTDVLAFAAGALGTWTRLLAPRLGAPWVFGAAGSTPGAPGQPTIELLREDYGLPALPPVRAVFGIAGNPVDQSLSPRLHNRAYREAGVEALYLPFHVERFADFWLEIVEGGGLADVGFPVRGLSVTSPWKRIALAVAGATSPLATRVGAANSLALHDGVWEAECTDGEGVVRSLEERHVPLKGTRAAVLGAGGAGRAAACALAAAGSEVTLVNRDRERLERARDELGVTIVDWEEFSPAGFRVLVNATPLGRRGDDPLPFEPAACDPGCTVVDLTYLRNATTRLTRESRAAGLRAVDGREVLLYQAVPQFEFMTGSGLPVELARSWLALPRDGA
ncbi:MAG: type I 3-dehydroquinate dehydratase [Thermoanaerobaculia bacterium]